MLNTKKKNVILWLVRISLTLACIAIVCFIFSNSLKNATQSGAQSSQVAEDVKNVIETVKPDISFGGSSKEEDFTILHKYVRKLAHFAEFALLSAFCTWCVRSYTKTKPFFLIPVPLCVGVAFLDEFLQTLSDGRNCQLMDVLIDSLGSCAGFIFAICTLLVFSAWLTKRKMRKNL